MLERLIESLGPPLIRLLGSTLRAKILPEDVQAVRKRNGQNAIYCFWHGRMLIPAFTHRCRKVVILVSRHRDGEYIAGPIRRLGFRTVRGSTTRGGAPGLMGILREARAGRDIAVTPDGPRGPRYKIQRGAVFAASRAGLPIIPTAIEVSRAWVLGSWDEFTIPKPFASAVILHGDPIPIPPDLSGETLDEKCREIEGEMHRLTRQAREILSETPSERRR